MSSSRCRVRVMERDRMSGGRGEVCAIRMGMMRVWEGARIAFGSKREREMPYVDPEIVSKTKQLL